MELTMIICNVLMLGLPVSINIIPCFFLVRWMYVNYNKQVAQGDRLRNKKMTEETKK